MISHAICHLNATRKSRAFRNFYIYYKKKCLGFAAFAYQAVRGRKRLTVVSYNLGCTSDNGALS